MSVVRGDDVCLYLEMKRCDIYILQKQVERVLQVNDYLKWYNQGKHFSCQDRNRLWLKKQIFWNLFRVTEQIRIEGFEGVNKWFDTEIAEWKLQLQSLLSIFY